MVKNILMRAPLCEIALSILPLSREDRLTILRLLSPARRKSLEEELSFQSKVRSTPVQHRQMCENLIKRFRGEKTDDISSYLRPYRE